ncbi:hypothetical protein PV10_01214 [Exophiala mesophila]|uniref:VWFA domain-containing protein n=1 Tax=Exophiala mesophila TaxID=212818 RepID=A0A0D2AEX9_EXOME|nr:uncharacterized protein PV10_01214 [Exophiala mesophila]KIV97463.1 hypothetical protein PV10_01214 [Exophiala mesophila]
MLRPICDTVERRFTSLPLEVMVLTDGEIWNQSELFNYIGGVNNARFFTLGIGSGASSALVEGIARAGNGFAQFVGEGEKMDNRVVRMLKGALTPHISDYSMEVIYDDKENTTSEDDFEIVDSESASVRTLVPPEQDQSQKKKISLFDTSYVEEPTNPPTGRFDHLPKVAIPKTIQTPHKIPALFPFNRTTVYLLLSPDAPPRAPKLVKLRGTSDQGSLELDIPVQDVGTGETLHQLAAKKVIQELEEGRGWLTEARSSDGTLFKTSHDGQWDLIVEREAVRIGVDFQVAGKGTSFVAVEKNGDSSEGAKDLVFRTVEPGSSNKPQPQRNLYAMSVGMGSGARFRLARAPPPSATAPMAPPPPGSAPYTASAFSPAPAPAMCAAPSPFVGGGGGVAESAMARGSALTPTSSALFGSGQTLCRALLSRTSRKDSNPSAPSAKKSKSPATGADEYFEPEFAHDEPEADLGLSSEITQTDKMHNVIDLQAFDGSWSLSDELVKVLELPAGYDKMPDNITDKTVWATILTIAWFEKVLADSEDVWEMVVDKAREWLKMKTKLSGEEIEKLNGEAGKFFGGK